jgi:5'-deoxynucleotidase YfbR-like HD superfamily hydrolase
MGKEAYIPDSIDTVDGGEIRFTEIHEKFAQSHFGKHLDDQLRWLRFKPEAISREAWIGAPLGADMNNLKHMPLIAGLAKSFLKHQEPGKELNRTDSQIMVLASEVHDWGESITDDKSFDQKSVVEDEEEAHMMLFLLKRILGGKISNETLMKVYSTVKDRDSRLGQIFNAIERVGYMRSGLNAWTASNKPQGEVMRNLSPELESELRESLQWLASNVAGNQVGKLLEYAEIYRPVGVYLELVRDRISDVFTGMPVLVFEKYSTEGEKENEQIVQVQKFLKAHKAWKNSKFVQAAERADIDNPQATEGAAG